VLLVPISVGCLAAIGANRLIAPPDSVVPALLRAAAIVVISSAVVWGADRFARRLLPLAALMQLSLVFPDQAPSRFRSALRSGSSRTLERTLDDTRRHGLAKDPGDAARQVVQLIGAIGDHDRRTRGHSERVRLFADLVGEELKLSKEERQKLQWGALLHDLGKAIDHEIEGPHAVIGADLARRYGEKANIIHAIEAHHADVEPDTVLDVLVMAADAISAARPGARRESAETYIKRLEKLEEISNAHAGVERTYAMQAGRELHVMVEPEKISDAQATVLAHDIAKQIEDEMEYPGQVRVVVIRESRAVGVAK